MPELIEIPIQVPSRNQVDKLHWSKKSKLRQDYQILIRNQMTLNKIRKVATGGVCSLAIVCCRKRLLDYDNLVGGCKQLIDALCHEGFIFDDSPKYLENPKIEQIKSKKHLTYISRVILSQT